LPGLRCIVTYIMTFTDYQKLAITTDTFLRSNNNIDITSPAFVSKLLGLVGETGEVAEKFKKLYRDQQVTQLDVATKADIQKELGDVLWYLSAVCCYLDIDLEKVAQHNLDKVLDRKNRGVTKGSGDNR
jgi:NTP pyrophosphatase (non-canonical NTP hydrolase)